MKLTAFISTETMEKKSKAQEVFLKDILEVSWNKDDNSVLTRDKLRHNLNSIGVTSYSDEDFEKLVKSVSNADGDMDAVHRYAGGHLFSLYEERTALVEQIGTVVAKMT